jgi:hypothetical protein
VHEKHDLLLKNGKSARKTFTLKNGGKVHEKHDLPLKKRGKSAGCKWLQATKMLP